MKKLWILVLVSVVFAGVVSAELHVVGPYPNYKGMAETSVTITIPTTIDFYIVDPLGGEHHVAGMGGQEFEVMVDTPVFAHSYAEYISEEGNAFDPNYITLTEIWTVDLDPAGPEDVVPMTEGFDYMDPYVIPTAPGFFTGRSGAVYTATMQWVAVGDLATELPGYDVSMITGDPANNVYVAQAVVPKAEFIIAEPSPYFLIDSEDEWLSKLNEEWPDVHVAPMSLDDGTDYLLQLLLHHEEGTPYSPIDPALPEFVSPELYVYGGGDDGEPDNDPDPEDAGLVMKWGDDTTPDGEKAAAWELVYGDPDLSNCIISVTATPPGPSGINRISLGMQDINGNIRSWWWNVPSVIPYSVPATVTIDTTMTGTGATNPPASGSANNPLFDITKVQSIVADENAAWVSSAGAPAPGGGVVAIWNYWHNLSVTPKLPGGGANSKWYVKWSQGPDELEEGLINGWDEQSVYNNPPMMADDWECADERPITDIHWWGSFIGWTQPYLPPILPSAFHIGIWTDVADPDPGDPIDWSHPGTLVWENVCTSSVWNFAGYDLDPRIGDPNWQENEACFQWAQFLSQDEWFHQEPMADEQPNIYWLSISAMYPGGTDFADPDFYAWGWKTRPHMFNDDAVRIQQTADGTWPPVVGSSVGMTDCDPVEFPEGISWDLAFELTTNEPGYEDDPIPGDIGGATNAAGESVPDGVVDLTDLAILAANWLTSATP